MKERKLETYIRIRMYKSQKEKWMKIVKEDKTTMTDLVISSVENSISKSERRKIISFIEMQSNIFSKIENNINQFAKIANTEKHISNNMMSEFNKHLSLISELKMHQNSLIRRMISILARG